MNEQWEKDIWTVPDGDTVFDFMSREGLLPNDPETRMLLLRDLIESPELRKNCYLACLKSRLNKLQLAYDYMVQTSREGDDGYAV